jgi:hypothetical protein
MGGTTVDHDQGDTRAAAAPAGGRRLQWPIGERQAEQPDAAADIFPINCEPTTGFSAHAGEVLSAPRVFAIFWGRDYGNPETGMNGTADNFNAFLPDVLDSRYMDMLAQYGVGRGSFVGSTWVDHDPGTPQTENHSQMAQILTNWLTAGLSPMVPASNEVELLFIIFAPSEVTLTDDNGNMGFCAYHDSGFFNISPVWPWTKKNLFFAVIGAGAGTDVVSHELAEAATDRSGNGWFSDSTSPCGSLFNYPEIGDVCSACGSLTLTLDSGFQVAPYWLVNTGACLQQSDLTPPPPRLGTVPDVTNLPPIRARGEIVGAGFGYSEVFDRQGGVPRFSPFVEDTDPGPGTQAQLGTVVIATVAVWAPGPPP